MTGVGPRDSKDTSLQVRTYQAETAAEAARRFERDSREAAKAGFCPVSHSWDGTDLIVTYWLRSGPAIKFAQEAQTPASPTRPREDSVAEARPSATTSGRAGDSDVERDEVPADGAATSLDGTPSDTAPSEMNYRRRNRATTSAATTADAVAASDIEPAIRPLSCSYPGCDLTERLELCAIDGKRLACPAHRMLVEGSYLCANCRDRFEEEAFREHANSRHWMLLTASIATLVLGLASLSIMAGRAGRGEPALFGGLEWPLVAALIAAPIVTMWRSSGFRRGTLDERSGLERFIYWLVIVPAVLAAVFLFLIIAAITTWLGREYRINTGAEAVKRGLERYARRY
jgi:hypothetical protein